MRVKRKLSKNEWIILAVVLVLWLIVSRVFGIGSSGSGLRVGWVDSTFGNQIDASYVRFDGTRQYQANLKEGEILRVQITTTEGALDMQIRDRDGIVYSKENLQTGEFEIEVSGRLTVVFTGKGHSGSFRLTWDTKQ